MMSAENARAAIGGAGRAAVRRRQLHARGAAGDQPAGQPHRRTTWSTSRRPARRSGSSRRRRHRDQRLELHLRRAQAGRPARRRGAAENDKQAKHNRAKVGSGRPSSRCSTPTAPGAIMDLPQFTIMPTGLDDWDRIWRRRDGDPPQIHAPRLREVVRMHLRSPRTSSSARIPWQPKRISFSSEGNDLGVPARVFPQWLRCTGCDMLGLLSQFSYTNTHPFRTDLACFEHAKCTGRRRRAAQGAPAAPPCRPGTCSPASTGTWTSSPTTCGSTTASRAPKAEFPTLKMIDRTAGKGASAMIHCESCGQQRPMNEAQGEAGAAKLPKCRGRHPHLDAFEPNGCGARHQADADRRVQPVVPLHASIIVMPESAGGEGRATSPTRSASRSATSSPSTPATWRRSATCWTARSTSTGAVRRRAARRGRGGPGAAADRGGAGGAAPRPGTRSTCSSRSGATCRRTRIGDRHEDPASGLTLSKRDRGPQLRPEITRVLAVERLRKVNALVGLHPDRRARPGRRPARAARPADPGSLPGVDRRDRGPRRGHLPAARRGPRSPPGRSGSCGSAAVGGAPRRAPAQLQPAVLRDRRGRRPGHPAEAAAVLAGPHPRARADPRAWR